MRSHTATGLDQSLVYQRRRHRNCWRLHSRRPRRDHLRTRRPYREIRTPDGRPVKITLGEMRATGIRGLVVFCADYRCSHNITLSAEYVDRWPDQIRLSDLEPLFVCKVCGQRGTNIRGASESTMRNAFPDHGRTR